MLPALAVPLITTGLQVAGNLFGQSQANKAQNKYDSFLTQRRNDLAAKLNTSQNQDYLDTDAARSALEQIRKNMKEATKATTNAAIQGGETPESVIATQGNLQDKYQNAVSGLVQAGQQVKDRDRMVYESLGQNLDQQNAQSLAGKVGQWGQFGQNVGAAAGGLMSAWGAGAFDKKATFGDTNPGVSYMQPKGITMPSTASNTNILKPRL